jgi:uncharacterized protein
VTGNGHDTPKPAGPPRPFPIEKRRGQGRASLFARAGKIHTMSATYLIDGYNLLHAMGALSGRVGPHGLEKARARLLGLLHGALGEGAPAATVVFDAAKALPGISSEQESRGLHILFAKNKEEADDVIERLIRQSSAPKTLHVVSDDHRVQRAARRRHCQVRGCEDFLKLLEQLRQTTHPLPQQPEKKERLSPDEVRRWLEEFGELERDPAFKKAFESYDFESYGEPPAGPRSR